MRAIVRLAARNVRRSRGRTALIAVMIALPVVGMSAALTLMSTLSISVEAMATSTMGRADLWVYPNSPTSSEDELRRTLPKGSIVEPIVRGDGRLQLPGRQYAVSWQSMNVEGLAQGMLTLVDGRLPANGNEIAISRAVAHATATAIGGQLTITGSPATAIVNTSPSTVVGIIESPLDLKTSLVLDGNADRILATDADAQTNWLADLPSGADLYALPKISIDESNADQTDEFYGLTRAAKQFQPHPPSAAALVLGALALVEAALVAAAAFAVGVRRRQRELGLLTAVGASRRQLAGSVLAEGLVIGVVAALGGVVVGVLVVVALLPFLDDLSGHRNPGLVVDFSALVAAVAIGLVAALIASAVPAWSAARLHVLDALAARRPASSPARLVFLVGVALVILAVAMVSVAATMRFSGQAENADQTLLISTLLMAGGAILGVFGFGATAPWLLERFEWLGRRMPPAPRIALRDTSRGRSRNAPIVTAMLAALAATVSIGTYLSSTEAAVAAEWRPYLLPTQLTVDGLNAAQAGPVAAAALNAVVSAPLPFVVSAQDPEHDFVSVDNSGNIGGLSNAITIGDRSALAALGGDSAAGAFDRGDAIVFAQWPSAETVVTIQITHDPGNGDEPSTYRTFNIPATTVALGVQSALPAVLLPSATAAALGIAPSPELDAYVIRLGRPVTEADVATAGSAISGFTNAYADASTGPRRPDAGLRALLVGLSLLFALTVAAIGVALGEAEARSDQRVLVAVGADPGIRRRITAARAGVLALLAGSLAVPAGLIPVIGLLQGRTDVTLVIPWMEVVAVVALLPIAAIVGALVLSRSTPEWSAFKQARS